MKLNVLAVLLVAQLSCTAAPPPAPVGGSLAAAPAAASPELARWQARAQRVQITRDDWGVPHIRAKTDADAVFGLMYAQAEDDFNRVETNLINAQGRLAEAEGEAEIYRDLRMKLFIDPAQLAVQYRAAPPWLQALMDAWADGLNYYLHTHPQRKPRVLDRFEPWMALSFSEGSIGGDIERVSLSALQAFYGKTPEAASAPAPRRAQALARSVRPPAQDDDLRYAAVPAEPSGSNGIAVAPRKTAAGKALLLINPHTSFFFRAEAHVSSEEGLNAYGALTWGQFFVYQGFNERAGWMHTSSGVDNIDEYAESIVRKPSGLFYRYGSEERPVVVKTIAVPYKTPSGMARREFTVYRTHHGPIVREQDGRWVAVRLMEEPLKALTQSYSRTKARNLAEFKQVMELHSNSSNNTLFADAEGNVAYFHSNFVPRRDPSLDWTRPVDGSSEASEWQGLHTVAESPNVENPPVGWVFNTNNWPYTAAGPDSPKERDYAPYFDRNGENPRGVHALRVLGQAQRFTLESLIAAAFDPQQPEFEVQVPQLVQAWDALPAADPRKAQLAEQVALLRGWDKRWALESVAQSLAVFWGEELWTRSVDGARDAGISVYEFMRRKASDRQRLEALAAASEKLAADFGSWKTPWGEINRFQRLSPEIVHPFSDAGPSIPVAFASARWGSLASFGARPFRGSKKWYGTTGNSFVAAVEFGADGVRARAVTAGGLSSDVRSPHFNDQAQRYAAGDLREVYFYPEQLEGHTERVYRPGE